MDTRHVKAIGCGLGVLDMARIHQQALASCLSSRVRTRATNGSLEAAETFFLEALSPFEAAHRGFRQANLSLRQLNSALERRNAELATINRELATEVRQRKRAEKALRAS